MSRAKHRKAGTGKAETGTLAAVRRGMGLSRMKFDEIKVFKTRSRKTIA
jgi:hypothetical protein